MIIFKGIQEEKSMISLFDELAEKIRQDPSLTRRSGPRQDIGLLLYTERDAINRLWKAADQCAAQSDTTELDGLRETVDKLRYLFGERKDG